MKNIDKQLHITMSDGSTYSVPVEYLYSIFTRNRLLEVRSKYIKINWDTVREFTQTINKIKNEVEDDFLFFLDECIGDLDWEDIAGIAELVSEPPQVDFQEGWLNGDKKLV